LLLYLLRGLPLFLVSSVVAVALFFGIYWLCFPST
jgi:hypothetical protein